MNRIPVFYDPSMAVDSGGYSPSAMKPRQVVEDWERKGVPIEIRGFKRASLADLSLAHDPEYVWDVLTGLSENGHGNRRPEVSASCLMTVGSFVAATREAITNGRVAISPTSGFHHAGYGDGGGFCTFNGLMVAAVEQVDSGRKVAIVDLDGHYGDGTDDIRQHLGIEDSVLHWTLGRDWTTWRGFLKDIRKFLRAAADAGACVVMYQAGADAHRSDPLWAGVMNDKQMRHRDMVIFSTCRQLGLPVVWNLAGGYQRDESGEIPKVLELHRYTIAECCGTFIESEVCVA